jgi:DNA polymerase epsilon subunit 4
LSPRKQPPANHPPVARVQKIINADPERLTVSKNAAFAIALATEMFIQHLATTTHNVVKAERKPRRNIQYRDVSSAVAKTDNLEFLVDVVPKTITYREFKKKQEDKEKTQEKDKGKGKPKGKAKEVEVANGQTNGDKQTTPDEPAENDDTPDNVSTAAAEQNGHMSFPQSATRPDETPEDTPDAMEVDEEPERVEDSEPEEDAVAMQLEMEMRGPPRPAPSVSASPEVRRTSGFTAVNGS